MFFWKNLLAVNEFTRFAFIVVVISVFVIGSIAVSYLFGSAAWLLFFIAVWSLVFILFPAFVGVVSALNTRKGYVHARKTLVRLRTQPDAETLCKSAYLLSEAHSGCVGDGVKMAFKEQGMEKVLSD